MGILCWIWEYYGNVLGDFLALLLFFPVYFLVILLRVTLVFHYQCLRRYREMFSTKMPDRASVCKPGETVSLLYFFSAKNSG